MKRSNVVRRRSLLQAGAVLAAAEVLGALPPLVRRAHAAPAGLPDLQYAIGPYLAPPVRLAEPGSAPAVFHFPPTFTAFATATLGRTPDRTDQVLLARALDTVEAAYPFSADGIFLHIAYGIPYFRRYYQRRSALVRLPALPGLADDPGRPVLEEAVAGPTDVHPGNPAVRKPRVNVGLRIERNEVLLTLRSDRLANISDVLGWLRGSGTLAGTAVPSPGWGDLFRWTSQRLMFNQAGLPRQLADANRLPFAEFVNPRSPMWMGFADAVADASGPAEIVSFQGNADARLTTEDGSGYFAGGTVQVFSHVILDLIEWYITNDSENTPRNPDVAFLERVQYMYRPHNPPALGFAEQFTDGGGPVFLPNRFRGPDDAEHGCRLGSFQPGPTHIRPRRDLSHPIIGHVSALQRASRTAGGVPLHIRLDGPGFDAMDTPDGTEMPKLQFSMLVPTADLFARIRTAQASMDLVDRFAVEPGDRGLESRLTATRRQNFLMPARRTRAFPLAELIPARRPPTPPLPRPVTPPRPATVHSAPTRDAPRAV